MSDLLASPGLWYALAIGASLLPGLQALLGRAGGLLPRHRVGVALAGVAWGGVHLWQLGSASWTLPSFAADLLLGFAWFALVYRLLRGPYRQSMPETVRRGLYAFWTAVLALSALVAWLDIAGRVPGERYFPALSLAVALACLALTAQLYRDAPVEGRGALRALTLGGALFGGGQSLVLGLVTLAPALAPVLGTVRPIFVAAAAVALAIAARARPQWSLAIFVSPQARAYAPRLLGMLGALLVVAALAPLLHALPDTGASALALGLVLLVGLPLAVLSFSESLSGRARVFISKHFLPFRYDYREEWLRLIDTLASPVQRLPLPERSIKAVAQIVGSPAGVLWLRRADAEPFQCAANWNTRIWPEGTVAADDPVLTFMLERQWILDTAELRRDPEMYAGLVRPGWLELFPDALLVVPLINQDTLIGFMVLFQSSSAFRLTYEEIDLLRTSGRQVAAHLAQYQSDQQLAEAQQFEAFNRLTAFVMHDLKNLIAQQSLMVKNAARHKGNPDFFEDAIATIDNSVARMSRLLKQLQSGEPQGPRQRVRIADAIREAIGRADGREPSPDFDGSDDGLAALLDRDRFIMVLSHLIRNAQEATGAGGHVSIRLRRANGGALIEVEDDGCGMDAEFVRTRLFRPFDSTKGSKGMGIGAYQARTFVAESGGSLDVVSARGEGTRFSIRLPVAEDLPMPEGAEKQGA